MKIALTCCLLVLTPTLALADAKKAEKKAESSKEDGDWVKMFDGKTLKGWKAGENPESFYVKDGAIVAHGQPRAHLFYAADKPFKNFEFRAKVMTKPGSNAGIYFHTKFQESGWPKYGYEVQVNNTHRDPKKTGSLYGVKDITEAPAKDNQWFDVNIRVEGRQIVVHVDDKKVVDYSEPKDKQAGKDYTRKLDQGTFALQGHDKKSIVMFKDLMVRRLP